MTELIQLLVKGIALGSIYALVALGLSIIYRATGVFNFAQGAFVVLGSYLVYTLYNIWKLPFGVAIVISLAVAALLGALTERLLLRKMVGKPFFTTIILTFGLQYVLIEICSVVWGNESLNMHDPWGAKSVQVGDVVLSHVDLWTIGLTIVVMFLMILLYQRTKVGLALRAAAIDQEAATAQGISPALVVALSWAVASAVACLGGMLLSSGAGSVQLSNESIALKAFPALILGGLASPAGTVLGAYLLGVVETLTAGYVDPNVSMFGESFHSIVPYIVMLVLLLVRPQGLLGRREISRA